MSELAAAIRTDVVTAYPLPHLQPVLSTHAARFRPAAALLHGGEAGFAARDPAVCNPVGALQEHLRARFELAPGSDAPAPRLVDIEMAVDEAEAQRTETVPDADLMAQVRAEAFAAGLAEGRKTAEHEAGIRIATLDRLAERFAAARALEPAEAEAALQKSALHLITAILGEAPDLVRETLHARVGKAAEAFARGLESVELRLNPADLAALEGRVAWPAALKTYADPAVPSGGFVIQSPDTRMSDRIADRVQRLETALHTSVSLAA